MFLGNFYWRIAGRIAHHFEWLYLITGNVHRSAPAERKRVWLSGHVARHTTSERALFGKPPQQVLHVSHLLSTFLEVVKSAVTMGALESCCSEKVALDGQIPPTNSETQWITQSSRWSNEATAIMVSVSGTFREIRPSVQYSEVIMSAIAFQTAGVSIVYSNVDQRKHQSSASLAFVRGIHRWPVNSLHKGAVTWKMFPFDDVIMK